MGNEEIMDIENINNSDSKSDESEVELVDKERELNTIKKEDSFSFSRSSLEKMNSNMKQEFLDRETIDGRSDMKNDEKQINLKIENQNLSKISFEKIKDELIDKQYKSDKGDKIVTDNKEKIDSETRSLSESYTENLGNGSDIILNLDLNENNDSYKKKELKLDLSENSISKDNKLEGINDKEKRLTENDSLRVRSISGLKSDDIDKVLDRNEINSEKMQNFTNETKLEKYVSKNSEEDNLIYMKSNQKIKNEISDKVKMELNNQEYDSKIDDIFLEYNKEKMDSYNKSKMQEISNNMEMVNRLNSNSSYINDSNNNSERSSLIKDKNDIERDIKDSTFDFQRSFDNAILNSKDDLNKDKFEVNADNLNFINKNENNIEDDFNYKFNISNEKEKDKIDNIEIESHYKEEDANCSNNERKVGIQKNDHVLRRSEINLNNKIVDRKEELRKLRNLINEKRQEFNSKTIELMDQLKKSRNICDGKIFQLDLFEELITYLIEKRSNIEEIFEEELFVNEIQEITDDIESEKNICNEQEKCIFDDRRSILDNIVKFSVSRMPLNENLKKIANFKEESMKKDEKKLVNAYCELYREESENLIFFENNTLDKNLESDFIPGLIPVNLYQTSKISYHRYDFKDKLNKLVNELELLSNFLSILERQKIENNSRTLFNEINKMNYICQKHDYFSLFKAINKYDLNSIADILNNFIGFESKEKKSNSLNLNIRLNFEKISNFMNISISEYNMNRIKVIEKKLTFLNDKIGLNQEISENKDVKYSLIQKITELNSMLNNVVSEDSQSNVFEKSITMANVLLDGFTISEIRKTDLKKISNLVKSKVSSYAGRRCIKQDTDKEDNLTEVEISNINDSEEMKKLIQELKLDKDKSLILVLNDLSSICKALFKKNDYLEYYLSIIETIDNYEKSYFNNIGNLKKIQNSINEFQSLINNNIEKIFNKCS